MRRATSKDEAGRAVKTQLSTDGISSVGMEEGSDRGLGKLFDEEVWGEDRKEIGIGMIFSAVYKREKNSIGLILGSTSYLANNKDAGST